MSESMEPVRKRRKISLACVPCRERKVRCSGEKPVCSSCLRRSSLSSECSYVVQQHDSILSESIQSLLDRLQRLESQNQSVLSLARGQDISPYNSALPSQQTVLNSEHRDVGFTNTPLPVATSYNPTTAFEDSSPSSVMLISQLSGNQHPPATSIHASLVPGVERTIERSWKSDEHESSTDLVQVLGHEADAMGASSVPDKRSPDDSTQYFGSSSGIAFMRAIRNVLGDRTQEELTESSSCNTDRQDPNGFKQNGRADLLKLLPTLEGPDFRPEYFALPSRSLSDGLLDNYWTRVYPLYPFIHRPTFEAAYATLWNPTNEKDYLAHEADAGLGNTVDAGPSNQTFYCALNMMLALGSQFLDVSVSERNSITSMFEQRSKNLLVVDMMDRGSIAIVQTLLLSGQYLQSTFCPQRCWNCIGVACRIAQGLGLHVDLAPHEKGSLRLEMRRRVWYSCMMLDMSGSMTMGRPLMISHKFSTASPSPLDDEKLETTQTPALPAIGFFLEATRLSKTLSVILTTIYDHNILDPDTSTSNSRNIQTPTEIDTVLELDKRLTKFQNEVPIELHWGQAGEKLRQSLECHVEILEMQANVLHARFLQSRILLYRTTFIQLCQESVSKLDEMLLNGCTDSEFDVDNFFVTRCAVSCVASARDLIKLVHRTFQSPSSDVWWYNVYYAHTAGMVMKLAQLCNPVKQVVSASCLDESWALCHETLSKMTTYGQVPRRCLDSLGVIQEKISRWERQNSKATKNQAVSRDNMQPSEPGLPSQQDANVHLRAYTPLEQVGNAIPVTSDPVIIDDNDKDCPNWSVDLRDWWSFPGGEFGFDDFTFTQ